MPTNELAVIESHNRMLDGMIVPLETAYEKRHQANSNDPALKDIAHDLGTLKDARAKAQWLSTENLTPEQTLKRINAIDQSLQIHKIINDKRWLEQETQNAMFSEADRSLNERVDKLETSFTQLRKQFTGHAGDKFPVIPLIIGVIAGVVAGILWKMKVFQDTIQVFGANVSYTYGPANEPWVAWLVGFAIGGLVFALLWALWPTGRSIGRTKKSSKTDRTPTASSTPNPDQPAYAATKPMASVARGSRERK